jgi:hypothetical protein
MQHGGRAPGLALPDSSRDEIGDNEARLSTPDSGKQRGWLEEGEEDGARRKGASMTRKPR